MPPVTAQLAHPRNHGPAPHSSFVIRHSSFPPAFAFLELLLVLLILALLAALAAPRLARSPAAATQAEAYHLIAILRQARHLAAVAGRPCTVTLEPSGATTCDLHAGFAGPDGQILEPIREGWARSTFPVQIRETPADRGAAAAPAARLSICFTPAGVARDYLLDLTAPASAPLRVQIRKPSGLVWLGDPAANSDPAALARLQSYWQTHLEGVR